VQSIQPVVHAGGPHGAYNDANGLPRWSDGGRAGATSDAPASPNAIDPAQSTDPAASMGDRILSTLRSVSDGAAHTWSAIGVLAQQSSGNMSLQQMMHFQMGAMQASVQFDYVGKIISRATQNLDQLVKTQ
jgi:type III secretion system YscI/HrpB-like protein